MQLVDDVVHVPEPGVPVTVYPVIAEPPSLAGALQETVACASPADAVTAVGAPGTVACSSISTTKLKFPGNDNADQEDPSNCRCTKVGAGETEVVGVVLVLYFQPNVPVPHATMKYVVDAVRGWDNVNAADPSDHAPMDTFVAMAASCDPGFPPDSLKSARL